MIHIYHHIWPGENGIGLNIGESQKKRIYDNIEDDFIYHSNIVKYTENECHTLIKMLNEIREFDDEDYVLFSNNKGATKPNERYQIEWREYLESSVIDDYKSHIELLDKGFDTSGVLLNYKKSGLDFMKYWGGTFYPGNFWWAKVKTFNKLTVNLTKQWGPNHIRYASESKFFTFIYKWNPATLYPSFNDFPIFFDYIVKENQINKESYENRLKNFL
jgi:hypothetical protein